MKSEFVFKIMEHQLINTCKNHKVKRLEVIGSSVTEKFTDNSDIDFIVEFEKSAKPDLFNLYFNLKDELEKGLTAFL
jgi:predicted nucleotidyltransferase